MIRPGTAGDLTPPAVTITSPSEGALTSGPSFRLDATFVEVGHGVRRIESRVNGGPWTLRFGNIIPSISTSLFADPGDNFLDVRLMDHAGNLSASDSVRFAQTGAALSTRVLTEKAIYAPGEAVPMTVALTNVGNASLTFFNCQLSFSVEDTAGATYQRDTPFEPCSTLTLAPGQSVSAAFVWLQTDDRSRPVPMPGDYVIRGRVSSTTSVPEGLAGISIR